MILILYIFRYLDYVKSVIIYCMKPLLLSSLLLFQCISASGQNSDPLNLPSIPKKLAWKNTPKSFKINKNTLIIEAGEKTDMFRDPNVTYNTDNAPKLLFQPDDDFILSVKVEHDFLNKWDAGALVLISDSLNWVKFCFEKDYTGTRRVVSVVTKNISDDCNSVAGNSNFIYLKLAKAGNVITLYTSDNGEKWLLIRHFQFPMKTDFYAGFLAQSPTGSQCTVKFSEIKYEARKIEDPYIGN